MIILGTGVALTYEITTVDLFVAIPFYQLRNQSVLVKRADAEAIKKNDRVLTMSWFRNVLARYTHNGCHFIRRIMAAGERTEVA